MYYSASTAGSNKSAIGLATSTTVVAVGDAEHLFDGCCAGTSSSYRVMVGRSANDTGPYVDECGLSMANAGDILFYHYYIDGSGPTTCGYCQLGINHIGYDAQGWPYVY